MIFLDSNFILLPCVLLAEVKRGFPWSSTTMVLDSCIFRLPSSPSTSSFAVLLSESSNRTSSSSSSSMLSVLFIPIILLLPPSCPLTGVTVAFFKAVGATIM
ncbi:hypothetical protein WN66_05979 [Saccharomyces cerevisiae]|nr:hypothetical protein WN66_05979 [Saccharomyces cerevisiae]